jgi:hypothetical protein
MKEENYHKDVEVLKVKLKEMISKISSAENPYGLTFLEIYNKRRILNNLLIVLSIGTPDNKETTDET